MMKTLSALPGWNAATTGVKRFQDLPSEAQQYVKRVQYLLGVPIQWIGVGAGRESLIRHDAC